MYEKANISRFLLQTFCNNMPKIDVTFNKNTFLVPIYGFKPTLSSLNRYFQKKDTLEKKKTS